MKACYDRAVTIYHSCFTILILINILTIFFMGKFVNVYGQEKSPTYNFLINRGYHFPGSTDYESLSQQGNWPDTLYYNTIYKAKLLGSWTIPFSLTKIEWSDGNFQVSPTIAGGFGYTWFIGDFIFNETDRITVNQTLFFGLFANVGVQNDFSLDKLTSIVTGGFIGAGPFSLFLGYDYLNRSASIELGQKIDFYTLSQDFLNIFGKVRELREHKSNASVIRKE